MKKGKQPDINKVLADITGALVGHFDMFILLNQVVETSMQTLHAEVCSIFLEDKQNEPGVLTMMAGSGFASKLVGKAKYKIGEGFTGMVAKYGLKFNIKSREELEKLEVDGKRIWIGKFDREQWPSGQSEFRNSITLPLKIKDQILGLIKVENKSFEYEDYFTEEDEKYLETIANVVALAIENARLYERENTRLQKQLKTIAAKAAHRIYNQVTNYDGIELYLSDLVQSPVPDKQKLLKIIDKIAQTTRSLKRMIGEFQSYGKPLVIEKTSCNLNKIIEDVVWLPKLPQGIKIEHDLDECIPPILIDAGRFAEAIKELLRNSIKAILTSPIHIEHGEICISTKWVEQDGEKNGRSSGLKSVAMEVSDNGPGFPKNFPIFEPFQSTDPRGTGLGLVTVKELVEAHGGQIEAFNRKNGGACIKMTLPL